MSKRYSSHNKNDNNSQNTGWTDSTSSQSSSSRPVPSENSYKKAEPPRSSAVLSEPSQRMAPRTYPKKKKEVRTNKRPVDSTEVLQSLLLNGKSPLSEPFIRWKLWARWGEVVGPMIAAQCEPVGLSRGTLLLWVSSSVWMQQLSFMKGPIIKKVQKYLESDLIKDLRFTLDRKSLPAESAHQLRGVVDEILGPEKES